MSRRVASPTRPRKASLAKRKEVARRVGEAFNQKNPGEKRKFVDQTLTALMNMNPEQLWKLFGKKRGRPSTKDLENVNTLIIVFLYSIKDEFRPYYATMIFKRLKAGAGIPIPEGLPEKLEEVRQLEWFHGGMSPKIYDELYARWKKLAEGKPNYSFDEFFKHLLSGSTK